MRPDVHDNKRAIRSISSMHLRAGTEQGKQKGEEFLI